MDCSTPGFPVHYQLPELAQTHVDRVSDAIQLSHPLLSPSPPAFNLSQHQGLFQWVSSLHQVAKVLELQLQHHSFLNTPPLMYMNECTFIHVLTFVHTCIPSMPLSHHHLHKNCSPILSPWRNKRQSTPVFLPRISHRQESLARLQSMGLWKSQAWLSNQTTIKQSSPLQRKKSLKELSMLMLFALSLL